MKRVIAGAALTALLLTGCGNDEADAEARRFCELVEQYNKGTGFVAPPGDTPEDQREAALTQALRDYLSLPEIQAILEELGEVAPPEVEEAVGTMRSAAEDLVTSNENRFDDPDAIAANDQIKAYTETACAPEDTEDPEGPGAPEDPEAPAES